MFNKKKNKETDPVKEKQKIVNESIKNAKKEKKKTKKKQPKIDRFDIKEAIPFTYDEEKNMFKDLDGNYIMMVRTAGTNIFGFKDNDQYAFIRAFSRIFNNSIGAGQIYSYMIGADVDGYVADFQYFKDNLNLSNTQERIRYEILDEAQRRLKYTALTKELVDRCFVFILKGADVFQLEQRCQEIVATLGSYQKTNILDFMDTFLVIYNFYHPQASKLFTEMAKEADDIMDYLYPTRIGMVDVGFRQCVELDRVFCRTKYIHVYRKEPAFALMSYLATAGDIDFSMHFKPAESGALTKSLDKEIHNI